MRTLRLTYPLPIICRVLKASRSGYYAWLNRKPSKHAQEEARLEIEIRAAHKRTRDTCGPERLQQRSCRKWRQGRYPQGSGGSEESSGIRCKQIKKFKATTHSKHALPVADNLLEQKFETISPNRVWVSDITYIATDEGWLYCAAHYCITILCPAIISSVRRAVNVRSATGHSSLGRQGFDLVILKIRYYHLNRKSPPELMLRIWMATIWDYSYRSFLALITSTASSCPWPGMMSFRCS